MQQLFRQAKSMAATIFRAGSKPTAWIPLARVEGDESMFPEDERVTADLLRETAETYDPLHRRAPIVSGDGPVRGDVHKVGELNPPLGWIERLEFDGLNLWGLAVDAGGRLREAIKDGFVRGSIAIWPSLPDADGKAYLRHFGFVGAQAAGTANLPDLEPYFAGFDSADEGSAATMRTLPYITRTTPDDREEEDSMEQKELMDKLDEIARSVGASLEGQAALRAEVEGQKATIEKLTSDLAATKEAAEKAVTDAGSIARTAREAQYRTAVSGLAKEGKILPAEVDEEVGILMTRTDEEADKRLKVLAARTATVFVERKLEATPIDMPAGFLSARDLEHPSGKKNEAASALVSRAMAEAGGDQAKFREIIYRLEGQS